MALGILVLLTALTISAVAIYYSVAGLVAIFAAAAVPIMVMGGALEIAKLVTAVWLHRYWKIATWWLKSYLTIAVIVLMLITSMGIFGFLSKAHIEQTSASEESVAKVEQITTEVARLEGIVDRAEAKITQLENSGTGADANIQAQIDKEQERIDKAFERIQPAIDQQNKIIADARAGDANRTKPYEDQLTNIQAEISRLEETARDYEEKITSLSADTSAVQPLLEQIKQIEEDIIRVTNMLQSTEPAQIKSGQAMIGVTSDGLFGNNTRSALAKWVAAQQDRISQIQGDISKLRADATVTVDSERDRLAGVIKDIRERQIPALKDRELVMLSKIDEVRATESPVIQTARDEIQRLRKSAEDQVVNSQKLIERLRSQLAKDDKAEQIDALIDEQLARIKTSEAEIDVLTEEKYTLQAEYRKLEAEVGPIKYIAEFIYGETDTNVLEEAVRWVILIIIFVFDPLAVLLLIASQYTLEHHRKKKEEKFDWDSYEKQRAAAIMSNPGYGVQPQESVEEKEDNPQESVDEAPKEKSKDDLEMWNDWVEAANKAAEDDKTTVDEYVASYTKEAEPVEEEPIIPVDAFNNKQQKHEEENPEYDIEDVTDEVVTSNLGDEDAKEIDTVDDVPTQLEGEETSQPNVEQVQEEGKDWPDTKNKIFWKEEHDNVVSKKKTYIMKEGQRQVRKKTK